MKPNAYPPPALHLFVCTNRRDASSGMPSCAPAGGEACFAALKNEVNRSGLTAAVWVTRSGCLGFCNDDGTTIAIYPEGSILVSVRPEETEALLKSALERRGSPP